MLKRHGKGKIIQVTEDLDDAKLNKETQKDSDNGNSENRENHKDS